GLAGGKTPTQMVDDFAAATSHRSPYLVALVHGADGSGSTRPYALSLTGVTSRGVLDVPAEASIGWVRTLPFAELTTFNSSSERGELAMIGRWTEDVKLSVVPAGDRFKVDLIYPDTADGSMLRTTFEVTGAQAGMPVTVTLSRGNRTLVVSGAGSVVPLVNPVPQTPLRIAAAAQDLRLNEAGHTVSVLFNRPIKVTDAAALRNFVTLTTTVSKIPYTVTRRNVPATNTIHIPGAAVQDDSRIVNLFFDKALSTNAVYTIGMESMVDALTPGSPVTSTIVPRVDNNQPGGIVYGRVLSGDNKALENVVVQMKVFNSTTAQDTDHIQLEGDSGGRELDVQWDTTITDGRFLFEFVPRDLDRQLFGNYTLVAQSGDKYAEVKAAVRLPGEVHHVSLVFLGRGSAQGQVRYSDGVVVPNTTVTVASTMFNEFRTAQTGADGRYTITDLPVGPLTFFVTDPSGRYTFAANQIKSPGEVVNQDLVIQKRDFPGTATVRGVVRRTDIADPEKNVVPNAHVGVFTQGYGLTDGYTDASGRFEFRNIPAGFVTILASEFNLTSQSAAVDLDLKADTVLEQTLILHVPTAVEHAGYAILEGTITRDDPGAPSDGTKDQIAGGAIISIQGLASVTADAAGNYVYPDLPLQLGGRYVTVFDPATARKGVFQIPTLVVGANHFSMKLKSGAVEGTATARVRLLDANGAPVSGYTVLEEGIPPLYFSNKGSGMFERVADVPRIFRVLAVPTNPDGPYGDQYVSGTVRVDFPGQIAVTELRLPGQGNVLATIELARSCSTPPCCTNPAPDGNCYDKAKGRVAITYPAWDDAELDIVGKTRTFDTDLISDVVNIPKVPARTQATVVTVQHPAGYASGNVTLAYEGDTRSVSLLMKSVGDVTGRVVGIDGRTPIPNAAVRLSNDRLTYAPQITAPDGSFRFAGVPASLSFRLIAEWSQDGIYRTGFADGATPAGGGPVSDRVIMLREQSSIEGRVTENGTAVPLAKYWARELAWPYREFGNPRDPLTADISGRFVINNVFVGPFRITAVSPLVQEVRGDYQGEILIEADTRQRDIDVKISGGGSALGSVSVTVVYPENNFERVPNAEVTLFRGGARFDFTTTDQNGVAFFDQIPVGTNAYAVSVYSKSFGRVGMTDGAFSVLELQTSALTVPLQFRGTVLGTVIDPENENKPVKGIPVSLLSGGLTTRASTGGLGEFEFIGVPEGSFRLEAFDPDSGRKGGRNDLFISKLIQTQPNATLSLEFTGTLNVKVHLPNDAGGYGQLAPLVDVTVIQKACWSCSPVYMRSLQGNDLTFRKMLTGYGYEILVKELGGEGREAKTSGGFAAGSLSASAALLFSTTGSVQITVRDEAGVVADVKVTVADKTFYTPPSGVVFVSGLPLGNVYVQASKGGVAASAVGNLASRSVPLQMTLNLGSTAAVAGFVEAEEGSGVPSVGTRVLLTATSTLLTSGPLRLEGRTGTDGRYLFSSIPIGGTTVTLHYIGPDDATLGATQSRAIANGSVGTIELPPVKLDATPPRVVSIDPPTNATNVSPTSSIVVVFSEPIAAGYLTTGYFQLRSTDDNALINVAFTPSLGPNGTYIVKLTAPNPTPAQIAAGQKYPLKSNVLYRFVIVDTVQDTTGNKLARAIGTSFTTVNYTEPAVSRVEPTVDLPIPEQTTFRVKFNKAIDADSFAPGGGVLLLEQLGTYKGEPIATIPIAHYLDNVDPSTLVVAPTGVAIAESSFYRLTVAGARDTQTPPNVQAAPAVLDFFSFDRRKPVVEILSPVPAGQKLVSGLLYDARVTITDETTGAASKDTAYVDWFEVTGTTERFLTRVRTAPFSYAFAAPVSATPTTYTLRASATDLSGNSNATPATLTMDVIPDQAPTDLAVVNVPSSLYPSRKLTSTVTFQDEGLSVTVSHEFKAKNADDSDYRVLQSQKVTRASLSDPWPSATFDVTVAPTVKSGTATTLVTVSDAGSRVSSKIVEVELLADTTNPQFVSLLPSAETRYKRNDVYTIQLKVRDAETGVAKAVFLYDNKPPVTVNFPGSGAAYDAATGVYTFTTSVTVPLKNSDTRVRILATAFDYDDNKVESAVEVIYEGVNDPTVPKAAWITPLDGAALPTGQVNWQTVLRVRATDDIGITGVKFESSALASPVTVTTPKSAGVYEAKVALTMPAEGTPFTITATISDASPDHDVVLPITIDPVAPETSLVSDVFSVNAGNVATYANKSVLVRGAGAVLYITVPLTVKNLMVLDGAVIGNPDRVKLHVTVTDRVFVDADSRIDVTAKGYLGAWKQSEDNSFTNSSPRGMTRGDTTTGTGALSSSGSHAGLGSADALSPTNPPYGSITDPDDFGSGGGGSPVNYGSTVVGANGGGVIGIDASTATVVLAGAIRADGGQAFCGSPCIWGPGAGGSISIAAKSLITGYSARITANGGDDNAFANTAAGAGGGRVAVRVAERFDVDPSLPLLQARGGRNGDGAQENNGYTDGGAGTVFLKQPGATNGELRVSSFDERYPASTHRTRGTPLAGALAFDAITIGQRALPRFDNDYTVPSPSAFTTDPTAMVLLPADQPELTATTSLPAGATLLRDGSFIVTYTATAKDGIGYVRLPFSASKNETIDFTPAYPAAITNKQTTVTVASDAVLGDATLQLRAETRAGRTVETGTTSFTIAANAPATIDQFTITPSSLQLHAGGTITVSAVASDDLEVKTLTLTSSVGIVTSGAPVANPATHGLSRSFT
ncbi:MAG TPA: carboxypeptidase regulatory-like domain-containing protein, partial [Thermoanaerobaculia bacterium]|nr:carboxypeptidase regulatory-like domain-containing protein [Thermoanaerobaculia bacterium]